jgi:hypothetical protein
MQNEDKTREQRRGHRAPTTEQTHGHCAHGNARLVFALPPPASALFLFLALLLCGLSCIRAASSSLSAAPLLTLLLCGSSCIRAASSSFCVGPHACAACAALVRASVLSNFLMSAGSSDAHALFLDKWVSSPWRLFGSRRIVSSIIGCVPSLFALVVLGVLGLCAAYLICSRDPALWRLMIDP